MRLSGLAILCALNGDWLEETAMHNRKEITDLLIMLVGAGIGTAVLLAVFRLLDVNPVQSPAWFWLGLLCLNSLAGGFTALMLVRTLKLKHTL